MPVPHKQGALEEVRRLVESFETDSQPQKYFTDKDKVEIARQMGDIFWVPVQKGYTNFLFAYAALFGVPPFVEEALTRDPDRFDRSELHHTVQIVSGFIIDGFGYDRRTMTPQKVFYWPGTPIRMHHGRREQDGQIKERISDAAMCYFGYHLIRASEMLWLPAVQRSPEEIESLRAWYYDYFGSFFRTAGYRFPRDRQKAEDYARRVDALLARDAYAHLWDNVLHAAEKLQLDVTRERLRNYLLPRSQELFDAHCMRRVEG